MLKSLLEVGCDINARCIDQNSSSPEANTKSYDRKTGTPRGIFTKDQPSEPGALNDWVLKYWDHCESNQWGMTALGIAAMSGR